MEETFRPQKTRPNQADRTPITRFNEFYQNVAIFFKHVVDKSDVRFRGGEEEEVD
jgi:hypothetical protein